MPRSIVKSSDVVGKDVINKSKENLGEICDFALDKVTGNVLYVTLQCGDFLGIGGKLFALPWNSIEYNKSEDSFMLDVNKETLKNSAGFDKDHWPETPDMTLTTPGTMRNRVGGTGI